MTPLTEDQIRRALDHRHLIAPIVNRHVAPHDREDAWQDGFIGLCRAIQRDHGNTPETFPAYAAAWIREGIRSGRWQREGINYRRDRAARRPHQWPTSLDVDITDDDGTPTNPAALLAAPDNLETAAIARLELDAAHQAITGACRDPLDLDIAHLLFDPPPGPLTRTDQLLAARHHTTAVTVAKRRVRLRRRLAVTLDRDAA